MTDTYHYGQYDAGGLLIDQGRRYEPSGSAQDVADLLGEHAQRETSPPFTSLVLVWDGVPSAGLTMWLHEMGDGGGGSAAARWERDLS